MRKILVALFLFVTSFYVFADRYIEDEVGSGGSDKVFIYLILIVVGWLAVSFIKDMVKEALRQTKEDVDSGRLPIKTEIRKQVKLIIAHEIKTFPLTQEDYLLNFYVYGLGIGLGGLFGALGSPNDISSANIISGALLLGVPWCLFMFIVFGRGISEANKQKIRAKYSKYHNLPDDLEQLKKIQNEVMSVKIK
ncbi:hypothetical protein [Acinetobacter modestus]|uniref:hypothetical protein n=1 Tax=Acinetobacter modestus TaxID=1776740 RepID=UPI003018728A